jgi:hypothetical protein
MLGNWPLLPKPPCRSDDTAQIVATLRDRFPTIQGPPIHQTAADWSRLPMPMVPGNRI